MTLPVRSVASSIRPRVSWTILAGLAAAGVALFAHAAQATPPTSVNLSTYVRVGRYDLPEPTRTAAPANSLLAQEASNVTYDWDTDTLFIAGDGGTSIVQVSKTGQLMDSMTLARNASRRAGVEFDDPEGLTYIGSGQFVLTEERDRTLVKFTYAAGTTLQRANTQTVKLGTTIGNIGLEGVCWDPTTSGFIVVKEKDPQSIFQTGVNFAAGTATNGSPTATSSNDLFNPALANLSDFSDVFVLSNLPSLSGQPDSSHLLIISQESGQVINIDRSGNVSSRLTIVADPGSPLTVPDMTMEGVTMDRDGFLYISNENGGGDANHPQLWVYAPSTATNLAPTAVVLNNQVASIPENTSTAAAVKVADITITDDGLGTNNLTVTGADAGSFQIIGVGLFLKAGTTLNRTTKPSYSVAVSVDDPTVGSTPDATSGTYTLAVSASTGGTPSIIVSEVSAWGSGNSPISADWFELTNIGTAAQNITGWKMDDNSNSFGSSVALNGITSIAPGESVIFLESGTSLRSSFLSLWFGANAPANLQVGNYSGSGVGLSTTTDAVNIFNAAGAVQARVNFQASTSTAPYRTFDNAVGANSTLNVASTDISTLSAVGVNGVFRAAGDTNEIGSPGTIGAAATPIITVTAIDATAAEAGTDLGTFRITRSGSTVSALTVNYTIATGTGQATGADLTTPLAGIAVIPAGQTFVDLTVAPVDDTIFEGDETVTLTLFDTGSYDVGTPASATITIADDLGNIAPTVNAGIVITRGGFALDRRTGYFAQVDTLTNATASAIPGPIYLTLDTLSANATLSGSAGTTTHVAPNDSPYVQLVGPNGSLEPGAKLSITLNFSNPTRAAITYTARALSGGNIAP